MSDTDKKESLTITLTDRAPVKIAKKDWPITARSSSHSGEHESQADKTWRMTVRQHADGRAIVYGVHDTRWQGERGLRGGELIERGSDIPGAISRVAATVGADDIAAECIADLPAVEI